MCTISKVIRNSIKFSDPAGRVHIIVGRLCLGTRTDGRTDRHHLRTNDHLFCLAEQLIHERRRQDMVKIQFYMRLRN